MLKWMIIGGGVQGCTLAIWLLRHHKAAAEDIVIIDPHETPLSIWERCTSVIQMPYLRSPSIHHLDVPPFALEHFAKTSYGRSLGGFRPPYDRPYIDLFNEHCRHLMDELGLKQRWVRGRAVDLTKEHGAWTCALEDGTVLRSKRAALAIGISEAPYWPQWANPLRDTLDVRHVFECERAEQLDELSGPIIVIGGGISAAHTCIRLSDQYPGQVTLLTRHPLRIHQFDSDPGWLGPKYMKPFSSIQDARVRREQIRAARHRGSMPLELKTNLVRRMKEGKLHITIDEVKEALPRTSRGIKLKLESGALAECQTLLLATGFCQDPPGMNWLTTCAERYQLPRAECGYPLPLPHSLEWDQGLHVTGALAELELGPTARNISGARRGAERIIASLH
ncbi:FAD/NAD(P)-binding protein [Marinicrinis sediminis]|uniref:FAD/NAD(P)-binding protein n=1 Tax=Marinicrinis sediminis TaxID=1652465 RepID=A0ABW5RAV1_9BACL